MCYAGVVLVRENLWHGMCNKSSKEKGKEIYKSDDKNSIKTKHI